MDTVLQSLPVHYSQALIAASIGVSIVAAYAAFCFAERLSMSDGRRRITWLMGGSLALGLGIWSMHYLGMLAMQMPMMIRYSPGVVALSLLMAIAASAVALQLMGSGSVSSKQLAVGAVLMGAGIGAMHYTGMAAMRCCAHQHYSWPIVGLSVVVAIGFSWLSLVITFRLRDSSSHSELLRVAGATLMGLGIASMHYTAMFAVHFTPGKMWGMGVSGVHVGLLGGIGVLLTTGLVLAGALVTAFVDRVTYRELRAAHAKLEAAHQQVIQAQQTLLASERALAEANRRLQELSVRDGLTRLYNRRHFDDVMESEWRRIVRDRSSIAFLMIDVDHFKGLNDSAGHAAGDHVLKSIAETLDPLIGAMGGMIARYGGEELAAILPVSSSVAAYMSGEQVREAVESLRLQYQGMPLPRVTVSVGVCTATTLTYNAAPAALRAADEALYRAKQLGRNRVESAATTSPLMNPASMKIAAFETSTGVHGD